MNCFVDYGASTCDVRRQEATPLSFNHCLSLEWNPRLSSGADGEFSLFRNSPIPFDCLDLSLHQIICVTTSSERHSLWTKSRLWFKVDGMPKSRLWFKVDGMHNAQHRLHRHPMYWEGHQLSTIACQIDFAMLSAFVFHNTNFLHCIGLPSL